VRASSAANGSNFIEGLVSSYSGTNLAIAVKKIGGSGTLADWGFQIAGAPGTGDLLSTNNLSDVANAGTARTNLGLAIPQQSKSANYTTILTDEALMMSRGYATYSNATPSGSFSSNHVSAASAFANTLR
jgi:hypothetical protein